MKQVAELVGALMLLTRLPVHRLRLHAAPGACVWAYPLVGALVGGIGAAVWLLAAAAHLSPTVAAILAVGATISVAGALHEDGLADTADGFGGGGTSARKLEIMRDSRIGSYGALALILSVLLRVAAVASAQHPAWALVLAGVLGRGAMLIPLAQLSPARSDGLAASVRNPGWRRIGVGLVLAAVVAAPAPSTLLAAAAAGSAIAWLARRQVGGTTGDVLGATEQVVECAVLAVMASG